MIGAILASVALQSPALTQGPPPPPPPAAPAQAFIPGIVLNGTGVLVGDVVEDGSGRPVAGAVVVLGGSTPARAPGSGGAIGATPPGSEGPAPTVPRVLTDAAGRFVFRDLPAGTFSLTVTKSGYLPGAFGRSQANGPSQALTLTEGERRAGVSLRLFRTATIAGTVVDDRGEPVVGLQVRAIRKQLAGGHRVLSPAGRTARTDDRGAYRLAGLLPGEYLVMSHTPTSATPATFQITGPMPFDMVATGSAPGGTGLAISGGGSQVTNDGRFLLQPSTALPDDNGRLHVYVSTYYPSAATAAEATAVRLASGEERAGVDLVVRFVRTANIGGRLIGPDGPAANYFLHLVPATKLEMSLDPGQASALTDADGSFMFLGVPTGQYVVQTVRVAQALPPPSAGSGAAPPADPQSFAADLEPTLWIATLITVGGDDILDLTLALREGPTLRGRIEFDAVAARPTGSQLTAIRLMLESADGLSRANITPARTSEAGTFVTTGVPPGRYLLRVAAPPAGWMLKSAMHNGVDISDTPLDLVDSVTGVVVTFTDRISSIGGRVRDSRGAADRIASVLVFPIDSRMWTDGGQDPRRMRMTRTMPDGAFEFGPLPPGDYYLAAVGDDFTPEWQDPVVLEALSRQATLVTLAEGQRLTAEIARIGASLEPPAFSSRSLRMPLRLAGRMSPSSRAASPEPRATSPKPQVRDVRRVAETGGGSISGVVLSDDGTDAPVVRARVSVRNPESRVDRIGMTDETGLFRIAGLPAGRYSVVVSKPAYLTAYYGSRRPGRPPGSPVALATGQHATGLSMRLSRGGVVAGRVTDEFGAPQPGTMMRLYRLRMSGIGPSLEQVPTTGSTDTDDRGEYRIYGLLPGTYYVSAIPLTGGARQLGPNDVDAALNEVRQPGTFSRPGGQASGSVGTPAGRVVGYSSIYYPATPIAADAMPVTVGTGQEIGGLDIAMRLVPFADLTGVVVDPSGQPAPGTRLLVYRDDGVGGATSARAVSVGSDGQFTISGLSPGRYVISARGSERASQPQAVEPRPATGQGAPPPPPPPPPMPAGAAGGLPSMPLWAQQEIDIIGEDVTGYGIALQPGTTITGRVVFETKTLASPTDLSRMLISLTASGPTRMLLSVPAAQVDRQGRFTLTGVPGGRYRLVSTSPAAGTAAETWQLKSIKAGGRDIADTEIELRTGQPLDDVVITFTDQISEISGRLLDASNAPVSDLLMMLFPVDRTLWTNAGSRRFRGPVQPSSDGVFRFTALPPGEYLLAAVTEAEPADMADPAFLEQVAAASIRITLREGEKKVQDVRTGTSPATRTGSGLRSARAGLRSSWPPRARCGP